MGLCYGRIGDRVRLEYKINLAITRLGRYAFKKMPELGLTANQSQFWHQLGLVESIADILKLQLAITKMTKIRVALVEDHDLTRVGIRTALQQRDGIEVVGDAANATEGLKLLQSSKPDVAIVDIGLPDFDGIELTQKFKKSIAVGSDPDTKVLILTFQDNEEEVLAAFAAGADSYCMKDISFDQLLDVVKVTHEGNSWIDPAIARIVLKQARTEAQAPAAEQKLEPKKVTINAAEPEFTHIIETYPLTERELEVLELIVQGYSNAAIAEKLYITVGTVKTHVRNILNKLCADDRTQAAVLALRSGLVG